MSVHTKLAQANPRSVGSGHHSGLSATPCTITRPKPICQEVKRQLTISFRGRGVEKGLHRGTVVSGMPSQSSVCCPQKQGRLEANYRSRRTEFLPEAQWKACT